MRSDDRLLDLLAARATEGLSDAEGRELDSALERHDELGDDDLEMAAAAIYLAFDTVQSEPEEMPMDVKLRLLGKTG